MREVGIAGFHCTKQLPGHSYAVTGLRLLKMEQHHAEFLTYLRTTKVTSKVLCKAIEARFGEWDSHLDGPREGRIAICLTRGCACGIDGEPLVQKYGGEAIWALFPGKGGVDKRVSDLLRKLGEPVVVECHMDYAAVTVEGSNDNLGRDS